MLALAATASAQKVTYDEHVLPIFKNQCLKCHNSDKPKADLDLSTFGGTMKGGSSGLIVAGGDPDGSVLYKTVTHAAEPTMPPKSKLPDKELELIKKWIAGGLLENSGSKAIASNRPKIDLSLSSASFGKPEGAPPMPGDLLLEPVVRTTRTSASTALAASPWAPLVALGGQKQVLLYNSDTLQLAGVFPFPEGFPHDVKFSRNGKFLLAGGGRGANKGIVAVWDVTTGERIITAGDDLDVALAADISSNQKWIALGGPDRLVKIYATATGEQLH
ncbi:MAG: c-type cytochrome domain-containing protein [Limisphaerales bacterium]